MRVNFAWAANPESNIAGYRVYAGRQSGVYNAQGSPKEMGNNQSGFFDIHQSGTWFFALTAHNTALEESGFTSELSATFFVQARAQVLRSGRMMR